MQAHANGNLTQQLGCDSELLPSACPRKLLCSPHRQVHGALCCEIMPSVLGSDYVAVCRQDAQCSARTCCWLVRRCQKRSRCTLPGREARGWQVAGRTPDIKACPLPPTHGVLRTPEALTLMWCQPDVSAAGGRATLCTYTTLSRFEPLPMSLRQPEISKRTLNNR